MATVAKVGSKLRAGTAEVIVIRAPQLPVELTCSGVPLVAPDGATASALEVEGGEVLQLGKRYVDEDAGVELLCTKGGLGTLECDGRPMVAKGAKPLPSSD